MEDTDRTLWSQARSVLMKPATLTFLLTAIPSIVAYVFLAGHMVTQTGVTPARWPLPFLPALPVIAIASAFGVFWLAALFIAGGIPLASAPFESEKVTEFEHWRLALYGGLFGGTVAFMAAAFAAYHFTHHPLNPVSFLIVPTVAILISVVWAKRTYTTGDVIRRIALRTVSSTFYSIFAICCLGVISEGIARSHDWNWNTSIVPWEYLGLLMLVCATTSVLAAHRKWNMAWISSATGVFWIAVLDPSDFFALPFRMLHW